MSDLIDRQALEHWIRTECASIDTYADKEYVIERWRKELPTIEAVPVKFIDEVIEYLTKCRDYAIHEETKTIWDEQRQTLIMLLHEWAAWNECGRTGKYGERRAKTNNGLHTENKGNPGQDRKRNRNIKERSSWICEHVPTVRART